jgi:hypothetical protein
MSERVPAQNKTSAAPSQATPASSPLLRHPLTDEQSESVGSSSNISQELGGIQPKTIRRSLNRQNISVEAPSRGNGMSLPGGIQRQQEEPPAVIGERVEADSVQKSPLESSNSTISTNLPAQKPLIARAPFNGRNIPVEAPARSSASSTYLGLGKDKKGNKLGQPEHQAIPKSLVEPSPVAVQHPHPELAMEISQLQSGTVLYQKGGDPKQVTQSLLSQHTDAKFDEASGTLTLSPLREAPLAEAKSVRAAAAEVARQTGVSKVMLTKDNGVARLNGSINPTVYGLANYTLPADATSLDPLIKNIEKSANTQHPEKEYLMSICREAANRYGAKVDFVEIKKPPSRFEVNFEHLTTHEKFTTEIVQIHSDNVCPACGTLSGIIGSGGTFSGLPGTIKPHSVVSASVFGKTIETVLKNYGITVMDDWAKKIIAAGTSTDGPAVTEDKQCDKCENAQGPWTLLQRATGKAPSGTPLGNQYQLATSAQLEQFTKDKIQSVVERIQWLLGLKVGTKDRPTTSPVNTQIVALGKMNAFLNDLSTELEKAAK